MPGTLLTHAVLVGLTPLIPVPWVDDLAKGMLMRRMLKALAQERGGSLDEETLDELARQEGGGCGLGGCGGGCLLMPFRRALRKLLVLLEFKRSADLVGRAYAYGWLVEGLLDEGWRPGPDSPTAARVRLAAEAAMATVGTSPVVHAADAALVGARDSLEGAAGLLQGALRGVRGKEALDRAVEAVEAEEEEQLSPVAWRLAEALRAVPDRYFERLRQEFHAALSRPPA